MPEPVSHIMQIAITAIPLTGDVIELKDAVKRRLLLKLLLESLINSTEEITTNGVLEICKKAIPLTTCQIKERHNVKMRLWLKGEILKLADGRNISGSLSGMAEDAAGHAY